MLLLKIVGCFLLIIILVVALIVLIINWSVHISMVKQNTDIYGWANYKTFVKEFNKYNWTEDSWVGSLWDRNNKCEYHASIVCFKNIGMIMKTPIDYLKMCLYVKKYIKLQNIKDGHYEWK